MCPTMITTVFLAMYISPCWTSLLPRLESKNYHICNHSYLVNLVILYFIELPILKRGRVFRTETISFQDVENSSEYNTYDLLSLEKLDEVTWPCALRLYLQRSNNKSVQFSGDYYNLTVEKRVDILSQLVKSFHGKFC